MSRVTFENYARRVRAGAQPTEAAGRYPGQAEAERRIVPDVVSKLALEPTDDLLEIGCGIGGLLVPLSYLVRSAVGIDHADVLEGLRARHPGSSVELVDGNFLDLTFDADRTFSKILIYSVLHCLSDAEEAIAFVERAAGLLRPGGRMLVGDIPNGDRKARFLASKSGKAFEARWRSEQSAASPASVELEDDPQLLAPDDAFVIRLLAAARGWGLNAYLVPQPADLPFGNTREDVLVESFE